MQLTTFRDFNLTVAALLMSVCLVSLACSSGSVVSGDAAEGISGDSLTPDDTTPGIGDGIDWENFVPPDQTGKPGDAGDDGVAPLPDGDGDGGGMAICTGPGEFMCECEDNSDCVSGYCVETSEGKVCTMSCMEDCPEDWACVQDESALPDLIYICLQKFVYLCRPCNTDDECHSAFVKGDMCVSHGDNGSFCAVDCSMKGECPEDYVCAEVATDTGSTAHQCVPAGTGGECECSQKFVNEGATTACKKINGYGECEGNRFCGPSGLTECSALTPKPEECNGLDDNCDGEVDPANSLKCITWYYDQDGDGYGIGAGACECEPPSVNHVAMGGDCDDSNVGVHPGVNEACNMVDDDCDGATDESFADGCETMYYDADNDGWGDAGNTDCLCKESPNYKKKAGDCNDENPNTHPEAEELCDGEDNNCDGVIDEENGVGCVPYYLDQDKDGYGLSDQLKCLCEKIGDYTAIKGGDCDDTEYTVHPTVAELCDGLDNDCDGEIDEDEAVVTCGIVPHGDVACQGGCVIVSCEDTYFDLNAAFADGCECQTEPDEVINQTCGDSEFLGDLPDSASAQSKTGKIVPLDDSDWFKVHAIDGADPEGCDTFHLRVRFLKNPNEAYQFDVYKGGCAGADNLCAETTLFEYFTDFHVDTGELGAPGGECKCMPDAGHTVTPTTYNDDTTDTTHQCKDQTADYFIRVYRKAGAPVICDEYQIEFSNGIKDN